MSRWAGATVRVALVACSAPAPASPSPSPASSASTASVLPSTAFDAVKAKAHVEYLADPARAGRYSGSAGYLDAATYVADRFREIGLEPLGDNGTFFQHFS